MTVLSCCWPGCSIEATSLAIPLCYKHFSYVGVRYIAAGEEERKAERLAEQIRLGEAATARRERAAAKSVVYYVRTGRYIKIGYTANLRDRLHTLRLHPTAVLATEPGGRRLEAQRHAQFAADRIGRKEDFAPSLALMEHIRELQEAKLEADDHR